MWTKNTYCTCCTGRFVHVFPIQGGQSRDTQSVISHFVHVSASIEGVLNVFSWGFRSIPEKTLGAEYSGFTADHPVVDRF